ncbi:O-fucosyltransferase 29 [Linum perenne]
MVKDAGNKGKYRRTKITDPTGGDPLRVGGGGGKVQRSIHHHSEWCWWRGRWRSSVAQGLQMQCRKIWWSLVCGLMLFALGMVSLFTGHMASDINWSQRLVVQDHSLAKPTGILLSIANLKTSILKETRRKGQRAEAADAEKYGKCGNTSLTDLQAT